MACVIFQNLTFFFFFWWRIREYKSRCFASIYLWVHRYSLVKEQQGGNRSGGVQVSCLHSPHWLSAEIGYWAHFFQYQCTENCSQKHQHLHPLNVLRKVLIKINDETSFTPFPLEYRGEARNPQFPWVKPWISAQFVPSSKAMADFFISYFTACWPLYSL